MSEGKEKRKVMEQGDIERANYGDGKGDRGMDI